MNKEELEKEAQRSFDELDDWCVGDDWSIEESYKNGYSNGAEPREKQIATLEEKISILLSCKNCPENKGGFICQKEYEDKCLAQKIQYIKELKEENENLKKTYRKQRNKRIDELQKANAELIKENKVLAQNLEDTEILNKAYEKRFNDLKKENAELKKLFADCDTCKRTCDIGNCCKFGSAYLPDVEKVLNRQKQLTKAKEHIENLLYYVKQCTCERSNYAEIEEDIKGAEQFLSGVGK